jgi:hypothetical protein
MRASLVDTPLRVLTWCCVVLLAVLSLLPAQQMVRTGVPGRLEHFVAYAGSAAIAMAGYGASRGGMQIVGGFWVYAAILEYLQHFSPGRTRQLGISRRRRLGRCAAGLSLPCFGGARPSGHVKGFRPRGHLIVATQAPDAHLEVEQLSRGGQPELSKAAGTSNARRWQAGRNLHEIALTNIYRARPLPNSPTATTSAKAGFRDFDGATTDLAKP